MIGAFSKDVANNITLGLDLQGGFEILYEVSPLEEDGELPSMTTVVDSISKRINILGVSEPEITIEGNDRIRVQLAGISDQESARELISATANLEFRDVEDNLLSDASILKEGGASLGYDNSIPVVSLKIADTEAFGQMTEELATKQATGKNMIVTWLDYQEGDTYIAEYQKTLNGQEPKYISIAGVTKAIYGDAVISGSFTETEAKDLASLINSGSLPVRMTEISSNVVSAEFGLNAFSTTTTAGIVGVIVVMLFMIFAYRLPGLLADIMLALYIFAVFLIYSGIGAVFTLTGIAALVLGIGMTVDANIITFERIKNELYKGRSVSQAVRNGQQFSFSTILDAQITTLIAGIIMYIFGNGAVKGFATMLIITVVCTLVLNVAVSRFLMNQIVASGKLDDKKSWFGVKTDKIPDISKNEEQTYFGPIKSRDYMGNAKKPILVTLLIIAIAIIMMGFNGFSGNGLLNLGIDFASGTKIAVTSTDNSITIDDVTAEFEELGYMEATFQKSGNNVVNVTIKDSLSRDEISVIKANFKEIYGVEPNDNVVTPLVGKDLVKDAFFLSILAWIAMLGYITVRFKWDFGISAIVALIHDVIFVLAIFAIFRIEVNIELVSVILAIIGYSINNSIVVFDRIREVLSERNEEKMSHADYKEVVNIALDNTIIRSIFSSFTTILPVIALLMLGSEAIFVFNIAMFSGLIAGTLSSIYISPKVWLYIREHHTSKPKKLKVYKEKIDELPVKGINA
jgi:SecD/SecF fusion protein